MLLNKKKDPHELYQAEVLDFIRMQEYIDWNLSGITIGNKY